MSSTAQAEMPEPEQNSSAEQPSRNEQEIPASEVSADAALLAENARLKEEMNAIKDQALRALADADNTRKRAQRDAEESTKYAVTGMARDLVSVLENLHLASQSITAEARASNELLKNMGEGVDMVLRELLGVFERNGIRRIDPMGEKFDHNFHQAVMQIENADHPPGTILQVLQAGYVIHDRLLRPAMVSVSKQGETAKQADIKA